MLHATTFASPLGNLRIICSYKGIIAISFDKTLPRKIESYGKIEEKSENELLIQTVKELNEYFNGKRRSFDVELDLSLGTEFELRVWKSLSDIPYGTAISYSEQASHLLSAPKSVRAIARANSKNPIPIIVPCHRVIAASNDICGYSSGVEKKRELLRLEGLEIVGNKVSHSNGKKFKI
ncbi:MAG: methylated-DNA--[protein]-cysteine S-methyltransferase [Oligoflexales bacterium]|nr:methylated-DNA--[protein]-cysteine S-methyltransferase [Oligoflexales bacterium]